jgi:hypothetical protein
VFNETRLPFTIATFQQLIVAKSFKRSLKLIGKKILKVFEDFFVMETTTMNPDEPVCRVYTEHR